MTVAIFGGSFDPPHIGHETIVHECLKSLDTLDKLIVVPTYLNPLKSHSQFDPKTRLNLVHKLFDELERVEVCDFEVVQNRPVYSYETVQYIKEKYGATKLYFIIGADNVATLSKWYKIEELKKLVEFVVITRELHEDQHEFHEIMLNIPISSTQLKQDLDIKFIPKKIQNKVKEIWNKE